MIFFGAREVTVDSGDRSWVNVLRSFQIVALDQSQILFQSNLGSLG